MNGEEKKRLKKKLQEMDVIDDFLFTEIMSDEKKGKEACRIILSRVLRRNIGKIEFMPEKVIPGVSEETHGIRMDVYITEHEGENDDKSIKIYDIEPDKNSEKKEELPKRSRYYADLIDVQLLETGADYDKLPELVTIFILSYDPFGANSMVYEAGSVIKTHPDIPYNDGVRRMFLYVDGELPENAGKDEKKLKALLKYMARSVKENVTDDAIRELDSIVRSVKSKPSVGVKYMKSWEREKEIRDEERMKSWEREKEIRKEEQAKSREREKEIRKEEQEKRQEREKEIRKEEQAKNLEREKEIRKEEQEKNLEREKEIRKEEQEKNLEREKEIRKEEQEKNLEREKEIRKEEQEKTAAEHKKAEAERRRADKAEKDRERAEKNKEKADEERIRLEAELAKYKAKYGEIA